MPVKFIFTTTIQNDSLQIGDRAWGVNSTTITVGNKSNFNPGEYDPSNVDPNFPQGGSGATQGTMSAVTPFDNQNFNFDLGKIIDVGPSSITVDGNFGFTQGGYVYFAKDAKVNNSTMTGHYLEVTMVNNSNKKAELFALSTEVAPSSK